MQKRLPRTVEEMKTCLGKLLPEESINKAMEFQARPDDVFIDTYPKSGTTWMQQIVHGLRTQGAMDFGEITEVVPWLEACQILGQDPNGEQVANPRAFKSHLSRESMPKGARYIYVIRNPKDVLPSFYRFFEGFMFEPGSISLETFNDHFFATGSKSGRYWEHLRSWWPARNDKRTLLLSFEALKQDLTGSIKKVANFLDLHLAQQDMKKVVKQSSFEFMNQHNRQFDDHFLVDQRKPHCNLPDHVTTTKVASGKSGAGKSLPASINTRLDNLWAEEIEAHLGHPNYEALRAEVDSLSEFLG